MPTNAAAPQVIRGLQQIERMLFERAKSSGIGINASNLHYLTPLVEAGHPPSLIRLEITHHSKTFEAALTREMAADTHGAAIHPDVPVWIEAVVARLRAESAG